MFIRNRYITFSNPDMYNVVLTGTYNNSDINYKDGHNDTVWHYLAWSGNYEALKKAINDYPEIIQYKNNDGNTCLQITKNNEIKILLSNWYVTMVTIILLEMQVLSIFDPSSFLDLHEYIG